ncbi:lachesin isoform X1 [Lepeophtheirus salmonis]|uniref:lachesin isoform X1 n=2 Tax=Lepeophtheirus salmonis TaxID=72036 RepID=UPI001AE2541C|nr:lachesin-like [Lepeophtheirus salmonis]
MLIRRAKLFSAVFVTAFGLCDSTWVKSQKSYNRMDPHTAVSDDQEPTFITSPETFRVPVNDRVILPCNVQNLGDHVIVWRKGHEVISAGKILVSRDPRFRLHYDDFRLELNNIKPIDAGDFVCQVSILGKALEVAHTVEVLVPPHVRPKHPEGNIVVKKGTQVTLECLASGNPVPSVRWSREHDLLPHGKVSCQNQHCYTIHKVDRYDAGRYICSADNGVGNPANATINLQVLYEPEIDVEVEKVHSGRGKEAHLTCLVHGEPRPNTRWYKDSVLLTPNGRIRMEEKDATHRYTLVLTIADIDDFGNYSCVAENSLGMSKRNIEVHGRPTPAVFRPLPAHLKFTSDNSQVFELYWTVDSFTPIEEYRLLYRQIKPYHPNDGSIDAITGGGSDWTNIIIPGDDSNHNGGNDPGFHHSKRFPIPDIVPGTEYECLVQARNKYGWSEASRIHQFSPTLASSSQYSEPEARDLGWKTGISSSSSESHQHISFNSELLMFLILSCLTAAL